MLVIPVSQRFSAKDKGESVDGKTQICPPDMAVRIAWALTLELSSSKAPQEEKKPQTEQSKSPELPSSKAPQEVGNRARLLMQEIGNNSTEKLYVNWVCSAIEATYRDLVTIMNGRTFNYNQIQKLRNLEIENINYYSKFTADLPSAVPRILGMTIGGVSGVVFLETYLPQNHFGYAPQISIIAGAVIGYIVNGYIVLPFIRKKMLNKLIKLDYDTNLYYEHYLERSKKALSALYNTVEEIHKTIFKDFYDPKKSKDVEIIVEKMFSGLRPAMCEKVGECIRNDDITPDCWSVCETYLKDKNCCKTKKSWISRNILN